MSALVILLAAVFIPGAIAITRAKLVGRRAPHILQPIFDILKLLRKGSVYSRTTSLLFQVAPIVYLSTLLLALLFVPLGKDPAVLSFSGDFILFAYLIGLGRFLMIVAAMDTGSGFEGMGANREAFYSLLAEPAFFIIVASMSMFTGQTTFYDIFTFLHAESLFSYFIAFIAVYILFWISMIENSRLPVDDPRTHLELTMVHEVMVLDHSGFDLALIQIAGALKLAIYSTLIFNLVFAMQNYFALQLVAYPLVLALYVIMIAFTETFRARNKMQKNAQWIIMLSSLAIITFTAILILTGTIRL
jgi:formate hydrogenlyase subunit 4